MALAQEMKTSVVESLERERSRLDKEQLEAVETTEGYVRVVAGAGSGKTRTLTHRYLYLVKEMGISPANILCVTFTNKAANEMKKRIRSILGGDDSGYISTFHGFCVRFLREEIHVLNYPKEFMILDEDDQKSLLRKAYADLGFSLKDLKISSALDFIGGRKANDLDYVSLFAELPSESDIGLSEGDREESREMPKDHLLELSDEADDKWMKVYYRYLYEQKKNYALDFDDLILVTLYILQSFPEQLDKWRKRMMYVMVDEYQDIDGQQYQLADLLSSYHKNLFVVGDPDQTIYGWRGADVNRILEFDQFHKGTKTILLQNNYRSTPSILKVPDAVIKNNEFRIEKVLKPVRAGGKTPVFYHAKNTREEAKWIVERIQNAVQSAGGMHYKDIAVLYRMHSQSRSVEEALMAENIPYKVYSGVGFYQRKEIKDVICYLRMLVYADDLSFLRTVNTPKRQFGPRKISILQAFADARGVGLYEALLEIVAEAGLLDTVAADISSQAEMSSVGNDRQKIDFDCKGFLARSNVIEYVKLIEKYRSCYRDMSVSEILAKILRETKYEEMLRLDGDEDRLDNLAELKQGILEFENYYEEDASLDEYLQNIVLFTNVDEDAEEKDRVQLMTIHNAKGLEFPQVFVCGLNEGFFPVKRVQNKVQLEEERRLAYVAFTRAENVLCLSDAEDGVAGESGTRYPSRFLLEMDMGGLDIARGFSEDLLDAAKAHIANVDQERDFLSDESLGRVKKAPAAAFNVGDRVVHKIFGAGTVRVVDEKNFCYEIAFDKFATPRSIQFDFPLVRG
ncbi:UvrD-helicase domain-containing protein [Fibrobacter sp.]|uniref:ATP-dependent helicase n=1 Tax=Fibrobacter sp. TaxID=35828 RepID=UPI0025BEC243|nr:UvrD-helicase domain-containing protein [Fibrobacter sp.]